MQRVLDAGGSGQEESPRVRYEKPRLGDLIEPRQRLEHLFEQNRPLLADRLDVLAERDDEERRRYRECREVVLE